MNDQESREQLCRVLGGVAAQLRGSMGNIHSALRRLAPEDGDRSDADQKSAAILTQSFYRVVRVLNNLSDAPLLTDTQPFIKRNLDLVSWLSELCAQAESLAEAEGKTVIFRCRETYHVTAVHRQYLERLMWNLLSNAIKFTPQGGRIEVELSFRDGQVLLTVSDNGRGISPEMMELAYERYMHPERLDPQEHGLGLGLPLCRRIAEGHGGRFLLTSREGEGTTATVSLPDDTWSGSTLEEPMSFSYGGFSPALVGLSDALSYRAFSRMGSEG
ncbi:MAG: sensor histidine kinase [Oscillospiraceae bacterium]|nr:sensor histidine kinase [Oscillospiraceae bacterium]